MDYTKTAGVLKHSLNQFLKEYPLTTMYALIALVCALVELLTGIHMWYIQWPAIALELYYLNKRQ